MKRRKNRRRKRNQKTLSKLKADVKLLKKGVEMKYKDFSATNQNIATTVNLTECLNGLKPLGTSGETAANVHQSRDGNQVLARGLKIRGHFSNNHGTPQDAIIRLIILRMREYNNRVPSSIPALLLETANDTRSHYHYEHAHRFKVYYDQTFAMAKGDDAGANNYKPFKINIKLKSECIYNGIAGTYEDIEKNGLIIYAFSNVVSTDNCPLLDYTARFTYSDS